MKIHVVGMGVLGSLLAWNLEAHGFKWTWEDRDVQVAAWRASTGCIYPGSPEDNVLLADWRALHDDPPWPMLNIMEEAAYWYTQKQPPHGGRHRAIEDLGSLRRSPINSLHVNVQNLVQETRDFFKTRRNPKPPAGAQVIQAHGFHAARLRDLVWGWSARVQLEHLLGEPRPALVHRQGSYSLYAYPLPGRANLWLAGSALIPQDAQAPRALPALSKVDVWARNFAAAFEPHARVTNIGTIEQGWRPRGHDADPDPIRRIGDALVARPYYHSGVRHAPRFTEAVLETLQ